MQLAAMGRYGLSQIEPSREDSILYVAPRVQNICYNNSCLQDKLPPDQLPT